VAEASFSRKQRPSAAQTNSESAKSALHWPDSRRSVRAWNAPRAAHTNWPIGPRTSPGPSVSPPSAPPLGYGTPPAGTWSRRCRIARSAGSETTSPAHGCIPTQKRMRPAEREAAMSHLTLVEAVIVCLIQGSTEWREQDLAVAFATRIKDHRMLLSPPRRWTCAQLPEPLADACAP